MCFATGNRFEIVLRSLNKPKEDIAAACSALEQSGFLNYYGLQRFGKGTTVKSHDIGRAVFQSNFKAAIDMLFSVNTFDRENVKAAKAYYAAGDLQKALDLLPDKMYGEKQVLSRLIQVPTDPAG